MSFPRYPAYKPSGVEWLGEVPEHWTVIAPKRLMKSSSGGTLIKGECADEPSEDLYPAYSASGQDVWIEKPDYEESGLVLSAVGARCGKTFKADGKWGVVANTHCLFPAPSQVRDFFWYLTNREDWWEKGGTAQPFVKVKDTLDRLWCLPPGEEQEVIATFLDRETAKIDALITEQQRLIELLQEKRQAVISHAVTKGLNPDAPMKDSGVEWLGEVPEHWRVRKLSQLCKEIGSGTTPKSDMPEFYEDGAVPWVVTGDLNDSVLVACSNHVTEAAVHQHSALKLHVVGSVVVAMYGATIGKAAILGVEATVNQACCVLPPGTEIIGEFLLLFILAARSHLLSLATGGGQPNINQEIVRSLRLPLPPLAEQHAIVQKVEASLQSLDSAASLAATQVGLLQERRSALISAAVTGQIDVRGLVPEASAA